MASSKPITGWGAGFDLRLNVALSQSSRSALAGLGVVALMMALRFVEHPARHTNRAPRDA